MAVQSYLGRGIIRPFRRDQKNDFANAEGLPLVSSCVGQVLGTRGGSDFSQGEVPWDTERGSALHLLRHQKNDVALREMARIYVAEALRRQEPRVLLKDVNIEKTSEGEETILLIELVYDVVKNYMPGSQVQLTNITQQVTV